MNHVLIVDDETNIRKGLSGYIDWQSLGCIIAADFDNGLDAMAYLEDHCVDLIISDIRMPGADGIELAKYVDEHCPETRVIFYTGYSDFDYAQSAIKYGVVDFIVKPSTMNKIMDTVKKHLDSINARKQQRELINSLESALEDAKEKEKLELIKKFINGTEVVSDEFEKVLKSYDLHLDRFCLILYRLTRDKATNHSQTIQFINLSLADLNQYTFLLNSTTYGTLVILDSKSLRDPLDRLSDKCREIDDFLTNYVHGAIFMGISDIHASLNEAPIAFMEAQRCLDNSFYEESPLTLYRDLKDQKSSPTFVEHRLEKYAHYISKGKEEEANRIVREMLTKMANNRQPVDYIKSMGIALYTVSTSVIHKHNLKTSDVFPEKEPYKAILESTTFDELILILEGMISNIIKYLAEGNNNYLIKQATKYIDDHYSSPIKLNDIAAYIHINSSYLSRLFKEKTNMTVTQYLRQVRVEKAKDLLINSPHKTYEIAAEVGFDDPAYFSYVFRQESGYSPSDYRNMNK